MATVIIQARTGSVRFPNKVLKIINGITVLELLIKRLRKSQEVKEIIVATTNNKNDIEISKICKNLNIKVFKGSENDVLSRYYFASKMTSNEILVRITGDCPFIDPEIVSNAIILFKKNKVDYLSNVIEPTYPDGLDVEVFNKKTLEETFNLSYEEYHREHVTGWMRNNPRYKKYSIKNDIDYSHIRVTIDEPEDLKVLQLIAKNFQNNIYFNFKDLIDLYKRKPQLFDANKKFKRNEGSKLTTGNKLWRKAKRLIPGGNMLLSKNPELFLPDKWPTYFSSSKGCKVWDLDGKEYTDMCIMGIGTNILGYGNPEIDEAVIKTIEAGNMSTLNCKEEVELAEKLVSIHPWSDMAKFARTGGEANAIAIRIARAATGKDKVAICGYHGWHDWYLATNLENSNNLNNHLLPGLNPNGVPKGLKGSVLPFQYNDLEELKKIIDKNELAAIKMEVERSEPPKKDFLRNVRDLCNKKGIVLIFDECTSGFRETYGGLHKKYNVDPDIAIFGKALGNGYAITAILGKESVMDAAEDTFISSTFWSERIGPTAALKTLEIMQKEKSWEIITNQGKKIVNKWTTIAKKYNLKIKNIGIPSLASFYIESKDFLKYKTFITQEMLKHNFLASNTIYSCINHEDHIIDIYSEKINFIFEVISEFEHSKKDITSLLETNVCNTGFKRLN